VSVVFLISSWVKWILPLPHPDPSSLELDLNPAVKCPYPMWLWLSHFSLLTFNNRKRATSPRRK
jgi:hypothetical protein